MSHDNRIAEPDASSSYKIKEIATGSRVRSTEREQYVTFSTYKRMDDRMRTALDRNLQFAAVRVGIKTELRGIARMALRRLKANAASRGNLEQTQLMEKADTCARRLELCRAMVRLKASHAAWRLLCARADRQFRLMALMAGFFRMKAELIAPCASSEGAQAGTTSVSGAARAARAIAARAVAPAAQPLCCHHADRGYVD